MSGDNGKSREMIQDFFDNMGQNGDTDALMELLSPDVIVDTPFSPKGQPIHFEGIEQVRARFGGGRAAMKALEFFDLEILATEDPEKWVATCRSEGTHVDGRSYANSYCWIFRVRDGKIVWWCEYYDPQPVMEFVDDISIEV